jgi:tetratricopeptide (TPR) repeat protein
LDIRSISDDQQLQATCLNYLGLIHNQISEYEQARDDYRQALDIYRAIGDKGGEAGCANNLGLLESSLGRYKQAEQCYSQALSICHTIGNRFFEGISLNLLGQVHTILGNYALAQEQLDESRSIRQAIGDRRGQAFCLHDLGYLHLFSGHPQEATKYFHAAANLRRELGELGNYVASLTAQGEACLLGDDIVAAYQSLKEALDHVEQGSGTGEYPAQNLWWTYAQVCRARNQHDEFLKALRRAYSLVNAKADQIRNAKFRQSYLENVRVNAAIVAEMANVDIGD